MLTPIFIILLFSDHHLAHSTALFIFILASITDGVDGYYARKYDQVTPEGKFLDPLADKILVSSAFISFAVLEIIEFWMVSLILFRDLSITGLRMVIESKGKSMITSNYAKLKTASQMIIIIFILIFLGFKGFNIYWAIPIFDFIKNYELIYNFTLFVTFLTALTGITYLYTNRFLIKEIFK